MPKSPSRKHSLLDYRRLRKVAATNSEAYSRKEPFPHLIIDDLIGAKQVDEILEEVPLTSANWSDDSTESMALESRMVPRQRGKVGLRSESEIPLAARNFIDELNSNRFISVLEELTGISHLQPDPSLAGAGIHQTRHGGFLGIHADFNMHRETLLDRRLNLIQYLNKDWREEYGGHLELWNRELTRCVRRVLPVAGRCLIFTTNDATWHGHPHPLSCPRDRVRQSIAVFYYTERLSPKKRVRHNTLWPETPPQEPSIQGS